MQQRKEKVSYNCILHIFNVILVVSASSASLAHPKTEEQYVSLGKVSLVCKVTGPKDNYLFIRCQIEEMMGTLGCSAQGASEALSQCHGDVEDALEYIARYLQVNLEILI